MDKSKQKRGRHISRAKVLSSQVETEVGLQNPSFDRLSVILEEIKRQKCIIESLDEFILTSLNETEMESDIQQSSDLHIFLNLTIRMAETCIQRL